MTAALNLVFSGEDGSEHARDVLDMVRRNPDIELPVAGAFRTELRGPVLLNDTDVEEGAGLITREQIEKLPRHEGMLVVNVLIDAQELILNELESIEDLVHQKVYGDLAAPVGCTITPKAVIDEKVLVEYATDIDEGIEMEQEFFAREETYLKGEQP